MGPVGVPEMVVIFLLALVLFGPKKLPELGRTIGKAISEFRRAQSDLKATFEREMRNLEQETQTTNEIAGGYQYNNNYNYDYSSSDAGAYGEPYGSSTTEPQDNTVTSTSTISASATEGAEPLAIAAPEGAIAHETGPEGTPHGSPETVPAASAPAATEHNV
ncbi:MAG TPA: twin-arginine translocase TatA/TatE family subunit [Bryobacteraceae bacterium]|nr:twin-arginine translocase TatA/TatE family subunit [Bryobacteraceae bacterium]